MKKLFLVLAAVVAMGFASNAQDKAIGVRGAFGSGTAAELSYQQGLGANRLELDLGWSNNKDWGSYINLTGIYQWKFNLTGGLNWYLGPGANIGLYTNEKNGGLGLGVVAQIGIEYVFSIPLQVSLDFRPQWDLLGSASGFGYGLALGIRYCF